MSTRPLPHPPPARPRSSLAQFHRQLQRQLDPDRAAQDFVQTGKCVRGWACVCELCSWVTARRWLRSHVCVRACVRVCVCVYVCCVSVCVCVLCAFLIAVVPPFTKRVWHTFSQLVPYFLYGG